ncbi:hypothetical protein HXZ65_14150, partial [Acinetobacter indicus]|uniref:hypothetical protein n=1 Tax=Acinetobacter indicus TaxID=756892 RepID=UPI00257901AD
ERVKKEFSFWTVSTRPKLDNFEKNSKKIQKLIKHYSGNISSQNGSGQAEREGERNYRSGPFVPDPNERLPKKIAKKSKKLKNIILALFQVKTGRDRPRKGKREILVLERFYPTQTREFRKN